jgi:hypothetical protein
MPIAGKHTIQKSSTSKKVVKAKKFDDNGVIFFPEKLARLNAILNEAFLHGVKLPFKISGSRSKRKH